MKYSGMASQLLAAIFLGYLLGSYLDKTFSTVKPYWTAACILLFLTFIFVYLIRSLSK